MRSAGIVLRQSQRARGQFGGDMERREQVACQRRQQQQQHLPLQLQDAAIRARFIARRWVTR